MILDMSIPFFIFQSELQAIAAEASKYRDRETGGDLYGLWTAQGIPVVYLAVGPGARATGKHAEYEMDIDYMMRCERILGSRYGIHYLGDWHSHHNLMLTHPSPGDQSRIQGLLVRNDFSFMAEVIVTHVAETRSPYERMDAYVYSRDTMRASPIRMLESEMSPIRELLLDNRYRKEMNLGSVRFPPDRIVINGQPSNSESRYALETEDKPPKVEGRKPKLSDKTIRLDL